MRIFGFLAAIFLLGFSASLLYSSDSGDAEQFVIVDRNGEQIEDVEGIAKFLSQFDVVFFGEKHDSKIAHSFELKFAELLFGERQNFALAMEMFEADNQDALDEYVMGKTDFEEFFKKVRLWSNYDDYRPIVDFARSHKIPIIAANIPRKLASMVAKNGIEVWNSLPPDEKKYLPKQYSFDNEEYRKKFLATMQGNPMMAQMGGKVNMENLFRAQVVKDEKMAESIAEFLKEHSGTFVYVLCGSFHSDYRLGTVEKLLARMPELKIATISTVEIPEGKTVDDVKEKYSGIADFVLFIW
ncbi:hypothetical protein DRQ26_00315 [bacterium]|nr:MAG: hypothetical protein DRQ26_00315 [bacterium]